MKLCDRQQLGRPRRWRDKAEKETKEYRKSGSDTRGVFLRG
jgi:hypothetical protein